MSLIRLNLYPYDKMRFNETHTKRACISGNHAESFQLYLQVLITNRMQCCILESKLTLS